MKKIWNYIKTHQQIIIIILLVLLVLKSCSSCKDKRNAQFMELQYITQIDSIRAHYDSVINIMELQNDILKYQNDSLLFELNNTNNIIELYKDDKQQLQRQLQNTNKELINTLKNNDTIKKII